MHLVWLIMGWASAGVVLAAGGTLMWLNATGRPRWDTPNPQRRLGDVAMGAFLLTGPITLLWVVVQ
ncbi:hypothetical protein [Allobranchiibius sp. GilTou38]|uniref:hypothetical protein n=1 Tax=Allobranchiibius sp. GilTou38 TaxID=2815210 RepID=UPI001AA140A6|nr:hypothetical protein [Allobranchiibius sp. GilTou38]MBO1768258.1 hypothetical protein [Allobranchiibius sp. GilTou38]